MKNYIGTGSTILFTAGAVIVSGQGVLLGSLFGVATGDVANGADGTLALEGVFELPKTASQAWTVGALIYWDDSETECTTVSTDNTLIGCAYVAVGSGADEVLGQVRLNEAVA